MVHDRVYANTAFPPPKSSSSSSLGDLKNSSIKTRTPMG